jgi:predicted glycosyltransferase
MPALRILMYCNDHRKQCHTSRTLDIAACLAKTLEDCSILVLTDLTTVGRFKLPQGVDYIHLPHLLRDENSRHLRQGLQIEFDSALKIRRKIVQGAIKAFRPELIFLDESLLDLPYETQKLVSFIADELPQSKIVWGLSDTLGEPGEVIRQWARHEVWTLFDRHANEIFIYGTPQLFDVAKAYRVPEHIAQKFFYTGYLAWPAPPSHRVREEVAQTDPALPIVMLTPGGSADDFAIIEAYLQFLEAGAGELAVRSFIFAGPAIPSPAKRALASRAKQLPQVVFHRFGKCLRHYLRYADLVICNGRYEVMSEVLAHHKLALIIPSRTENLDNFYRAKLLQQRGLVTILPPTECHPLTLREMMVRLLCNGQQFRRNSRYQDFFFDGFSRIAERVQLLTAREQPVTTTPVALAA